MAAKTPRAYLAGVLKPLLPRDWQIVPSQRNLDKIEKPVVRISQRGVQRLAQAPNGRLEVEMLVTVSAPQRLLQGAEDALDDLLLEFVHQIDKLGIRWTDARKVVTDDAGQRLGYDITLYLISEPKE